MTRPEDQPGITAVGEVFTYHIFGVPAECEGYLREPDSFSLKVTGLVERELSLSLGELRSGFPEHSGEMILQCMTNVHWGRVQMTGPRLADVLERAGVCEGAVKLAFRSADGFDSDLKIEEVTSSPDSFLLAHSMNGEPLTLEHGFPLRLASDGRYGYKWPKWLSAIELVDHDYRGHYEGRRGWSDEGMRGRPVT